MKQERSRSVVGAVAFTDIVGSTAIADEMGDRRWRELLSRHHGIARRELRRFGGREIDTAGDGFFVFFTRPADAIRWADAVEEGVRTLGIEVRAGIHVGESEQLGKKVSGMTVHIGARVLSVAGPREILVTSTVREMIPSAGFQFEDHGVHQLKGVLGEWHLYRVAAIDGRPRTPPLDEEEARARRASIQPPSLPGRTRLLVTAAGVVAVAAIAGVVLTRGGHAAMGPGATPAAVNQFLFGIDARSPSSTKTFALPGHPTAVAFGAGDVWVALGLEGKLARVDAASGKVERTFTVNAGADAVAVGADAAWVAGTTGVLSRIDLDSGDVQNVAVGGLLEAIAVTDDAVWVSTSEGTVTLVDPVSMRVVRSTRIGDIEQGIAHVGLAAGDDGVWVNTSSQSGISIFSVVWHVSSDGDVDVGLRLWGGDGGSPGQAGVTLVGSDLWAVDYKHDALALLDPNARGLPDEHGEDLGRGVFGVRQSVLVGFGNRPGYVVVDEDGDPWVLNMFGHSVSHVSHFDYGVVETVDVPRGAVGVATGDGRIWVAVNGQ